jgi:hypothetical protein
MNVIHQLKENVITFDGDANFLDKGDINSLLHVCQPQREIGYIVLRFISFFSFALHCTAFCMILRIK